MLIVYLPIVKLLQKSIHSCLCVAVMSLFSFHGLE